MITFGGVGLLYCNKISEATVTAVGGLLASLGSIQFAKQKQEELREMMEDLDKD
ncbi:hypothetical protein [Microcoleus sp. PH2017_18_LLB_O_A]|nr:hypothetical protein [Microcoleus sp. PH2017_18_LLB_O_A]MCC3515450.1 hypothetical protein [Microcoleus sp. PH2017_18_LLB_O_A]